MIKKVFCLILAFCFVLLVGCENTKKTTKKPKTNNQKIVAEKDSVISLLYNKADSLNPYSAVTENNRNICKLIFEPLVKTDNDFKPVLRLASSVELTDNKCTVTIKDASFSDGTSVFAKDIIYSYNIAKSYGGLYTSHLYEVASVSEVSSKSVVFNLTVKDPYFENLLDFPILKAGSDKITDSDAVLIPPIGCGRYTVSADKTKLSRNDLFFGKKGEIKEINLINAPDDDSSSHYIEVGASATYYTEMASEKVVRMSGKKVDVNTNNLIYLGVNLLSGELSNKYLRYAISSAIDRKTICSKCYFDSAVPATGYFNPCIKEIKAIQSIKTSTDEQITVENLSKLGYNNKDNDGYCVNSSGKRLVLRLLVNSENRFRVVTAQQIASQLKAVGIEIKIIETSFEDYFNILNSNSFDLYLGEVSIMPNFDMSSLVIEGGSSAYGVRGQNPAPQSENPEEANIENEQTPVINNSIKNVISNYYSGNASINDVAGTLLTEMVQIPIVYRKGLLYYKDSIVSGVYSTESDIYYSIENYVIE